MSIVPLRATDPTNAERQRRFRARRRNAAVTPVVTLSAVEVARLAGLLASGDVTPGEAAFAGHVLRLVQMLPKSATVPVG